MTGDAETAFLRLQRVNWPACGEGTSNPHHRRLFFDYIEIARGICRRIGSNATLNQRLSGLFDYVPQRYSKSHPLPETVMLWIEKVLMRDYKWRSRSQAASAAHGFILWHELSESERMHFCEDPMTLNPYGKLVSFFEAGGAFSCEHDMFDQIYPLAPDDPALRQ